MQDRPVGPPLPLALAEDASAHTTQVILATPPSRAHKRGPWRTQQLTNALFCAFKRTAKAKETRTDELSKSP